MLTLRQIEVIRAIMVTGTVGGAARLLNVSSPGISRVMKHAELSVGVKLFDRKGGRYSPTREANAIFNQINGVYDKVEDLQFVISRIKRGANTELKIGSVPSIANVMVPRAIADVRKSFPNLLIEVDILKIEDAIDYLLLGKGELVALSSKFDHPMLTFEPLARGRLKCIVPEDHPLARRGRVTAAEIVEHPLIGVDPNDPYGRIMAAVFASHALHYDVTIRARFGSTVCALVGQGLGIAIIDEFTLAADQWPGIRALDIAEPTAFETFVVHRRDATLSSYASRFVAALRNQMINSRASRRTDERSRRKVTAG
ncbi:MAG: LysR family transcriptional regulator [Pseudolabrys sp.]|nr:LysR family transcriptional regulator [Pseudolabrys sp.]